MKAITQSLNASNIWKSVLIDFSALAFIYLVPTLSHLLNIPLYFIEPMRLMLVFSLVHTTKRNAYLIALSLPLFSFLISSHPVFAKMILISFELSLNVYLFYLLKDRLQKVFPAILLSIIASKVIYYGIKYVLIYMAVLNTGLISTPIYIQVITTLSFSIYLYIVLGRTYTKS